FQDCSPAEFPSAGEYCFATISIEQVKEIHQLNIEAVYLSNIVMSLAMFNSELNIFAKIQTEQK
ncbi:MAG: hypothetical protein Q7U86_09620, partial [Draconibacterium sp.]|nr:hypothetical protein [Draconibacterium sp.]